MKKLILFSTITVIMISCSKEKRTDSAAKKMQDFVINISNYARMYNPNFIIIPQNGVELAFNNADPNETFNSAYLSAINGFGVEELFYNGSYSLNNENLFMLRKLKSLKPILVSEYVTSNNNINEAFKLNNNEGFICFVRNNTNYYYTQIPDSAINSNNNNITDISMAKNYLYLISTDNFSTKEDMINAISATNFDLIIIDLFFDDKELSFTEVNKLKNKANGGQRKVISYISIGSAENFRYYWKKSWGLHHPLWLKKKYDGYDDEIWVKFWKKEWQEIIYNNDNSYIKKIINAGFDGAYLDNVEAYYFLYNKE